MKPENKLRKDQFEDLVHLMKNKRFALLSDPGTGKTPPACVYFYWLWSELQEKTVWCMPKTIRKKNKQELLDWSEFKDEEVVIWEGEDVTHSPGKVFIMTFARWRKSWRKLLQQQGYGKGGINCVSGDETQLGWKGASSQTIGNLNQAMCYIERFVPMTGTLIAGRLDSAYPVINIIEPNYYSGHEHFLATHAIQDEWGKVLAWTNHDKLSKIILRHATSRSFEEVHGKESKVVQIELCDMAPKQRAKYDEFEKTDLLELEDRWLDASNAPGVGAIRCRQIMAHPECVRLPIAHDDKGKPIEWKEYNLTDGEPTGKDDQLLLHLEDHKRTGKPLVIFGTLIPELDRIGKLCRDAGLTTGVVHSRISDADCDRYLARFEAQQLQVLVVSPTKAGAGLNWPFLDHMIFASMDYQDDHFLQAYRRAMRGKRSCPLRITILQYRDSMDQPIMAIVVRKSKDASLVDPKKLTLDFREDKSPQAPAPKPQPVGKLMSLRDLGR